MNDEKIKIKYGIFFIFFLLCFLTSFAKPVNATTYHMEDSKNDTYRITYLDFLYVVGSEFPDRPESISDVEDIIDKMVRRSEENGDEPECINIRDIYVITDDPTYYAVIVEMEDRIKDCSPVKIIGILENDDDDWIEFEIEWDDSDGSDYEWTSEDFEGNDTVGGISGEQAGIALPKSECPGWNEDDGDILVIAMEGEPNPSDPLGGAIYYDFYPNSAGPTEEELSIYQGWEPLTGYIVQLSEFLFGWLFVGFLPFLFFIALLIAGGQILFDRLNRYLHWIGFGVLLFALYPIIFFSLQINLVGAYGIADIFAVLALCTLLSFIVFIAFSVANGLFSVIRKYRVPYSIGLALMFSLQMIYTLIYMTPEHVMAITLLTIFCALIYVFMRVSKSLGRHN